MTHTLVNVFLGPEKDPEIDIVDAEKTSEPTLTILSAVSGNDHPMQAKHRLCATGSLQACDLFVEVAHMHGLASVELVEDCAQL